MMFQQYNGFSFFVECMLTSLKSFLYNEVDLILCQMFWNLLLLKVSGYNVILGNIRLSWKFFNFNSTFNLFPIHYIPMKELNFKYKCVRYIECDEVQWIEAGSQSLNYCTRFRYEIVWAYINTCEILGLYMSFLHAIQCLNISCTT